jgi:hypothetical protein
VTLIKHLIENKNPFFHLAEPYGRPNMFTSKVPSKTDVIKFNTFTGYKNIKKVLFYPIKELICLTNIGFKIKNYFFFFFC